MGLTEKHYDGMLRSIYGDDEVDAALARAVTRRREDRRRRVRLGWMIIIGTVLAVVAGIGLAELLDPISHTTADGAIEWRAHPRSSTP